MRQYIDLIAENQSGYPDRLADASAIADYITDLDPNASYHDIEMSFEDNYPDCGATLTMVPIEALTPGPEDANIRSAAKEKRYAKMTTVAPPLVVADGQIMDGHHRYRIALAKGMTEMACYVVDEE